MRSLEVRGLEARNGEFALGPVSFSLAEHDVLAVQGPSGSGKTTLLRALAGFLPVAPGALLRDGEDLGALPPESRGVGYVPQGLGLFPHRTVRGNVSYPMEIRDRPNPRRVVETLLDRFGLTALASRYPATLSGGERQRVAMARALAAEPSWLLWDEPYASLDLEARESLLETLELGLSDRPVPVLLVAHEPGLAYALARKVLVLDAGRPVYLGGVERMRRAPPNAFTARLSGYENVFPRSQLVALSDSPFARSLLARSGPAGVAFYAEDAQWSPGPGKERFPLTVRGLRPAPRGWIVRGVSQEGLGLSLLWPEANSTPPPAPGTSLPFHVGHLWPLGLPRDEGGAD